MQYVLKGVASEDMIQLFDAGGSPVLGLVDTDVQVSIRKDDEAGFTSKPLVPADWVDRGGGNYSIQFSVTDFDTLGLFRYRVVPVVVGSFVGYQDSLSVVDEIPSFPPQPPTINPQTSVPPGVTPNPVFRGDPLTINGSDLGGATQVTIGGVPVPIISNTASQIVVTVTEPPASPYVPLGSNLPVVVSTPGGDAEAQVDVVLSPADLPAGKINITGYLFDPETMQPDPDGYVWGRILDQPNIEDGVGWRDRAWSVKTDDDGFFTIAFPRNKMVEVSIPEYNYRRVFRTPDLETADLFREIPNQEP